jgi:hypothetical protein
MWLLEQTPIVFLNIFYQLVFLTELQVRTEFLNIIWECLV